MTTGWLIHGSSKCGSEQIQRWRGRREVQTAQLMVRRSDRCSSQLDLRRASVTAAGLCNVSKNRRLRQWEDGGSSSTKETNVTIGSLQLFGLWSSDEGEGTSNLRSTKFNGRFTPCHTWDTASLVSPTLMSITHFLKQLFVNPTTKSWASGRLQLLTY